MAVAGGAVALPAAGDRAAIERMVRDYILAHPEIIPEAMARLQQRETGKLVDASRAAIETPFPGAWAGAKDGDVTLVEFFDYACGYCRQAVPDIERLLAEDKKLRIVFRELPILGPGSEDAAKASLVAAKQGRFLDFHRRMYAAGRPAAASIAAARRASGSRRATVGEGHRGRDREEYRAGAYAQPHRHAELRRGRPDIERRGRL